MMDFDFMVFVRFVVLIGFGFFGTLGLCSMAISCRDENLAIRRRNEERERADIRWCHSHGGGWVPVGGDRYRIVRGCVFPPNGGER